MSLKNLPLLAAVLACLALSAQAQAPARDALDSYESTAAKARRFFENREWLNASAMYTLMVHSRPSVVENYGYAIVSNEMTADTLAVSHLLEQSMLHNVPLDSVLDSVRRISIGVGSPAGYESLLFSVRRAYPWLARSLDNNLMKYYEFRDNGPKMVEYSRRMLEGLPDNVPFMRVLARGYLLSGDFDAACSEWKRILEVDPGNYDSLVDLANFYVTGGDCEAALPYIRRACDMRPTPYLDSLLRKCSPSDKK